MRLASSVPYACWIFAPPDGLTVYVNLPVVCSACLMNTLFGVFSFGLKTIAIDHE